MLARRVNAQTNKVLEHCERLVIGEIAELLHDSIAENDLGLVVGEAPAATQRSATESGGTIPDPINIEAKFRADIFKGPFRRTVKGEIGELIDHLAAGRLDFGG